MLTVKRNIITAVFAAILLIIVIFVSAPTSFAARWDVDADSLSAYVSAFEVQFNDANNDNIVSYADVVWFSGVTYKTTPGVPSTYVTKSQIVNIPNLSITDGGLTLQYIGGGIGGSPGSWYLGPPTYYYLDAGLWNYTATSVPIPGAVWLLGSGLIGIVGVRRKLKT